MDNLNFASSCLHVVLNVFIFMLSHVDHTLQFQTLSLNHKITNPSFEFETWHMQFSGHLSTTTHDYL
jgi:hypothetical protein